MTATTVHHITGYDRATEQLVVEYSVNPSDLHAVMKIAKVASTDPEAYGSYPLDPSQLHALTNLMHQTFDTERYDFFLEPFAC